ncbi:MAG: DUF4340 domain-containing protein [Gammaproteobacteria bacterium]|nr:DUF4340 domain-containing protein [Gammaproteobacteria bacterium]MBU1656283.1 DUF4340 domain-containing protein [Gammaproteobacteria bacterium]MBU1959848.1 DUF4340 domain-containing protein [Gammaproteobacteria bacterium]
MNRKLLINLLLLLLVSVMGVFVWLEHGREPERLDRLTAQSPDEAQTLHIEHPDGKLIAFEKRGGDWHMLRPYDMPANRIRLIALARVVQAPIISSFPLPKEGLGQFGLDRPIRLQVDKERFLFGASNPVNNQRYVEHGGRLHLIVDRFYHHLGALPEQLLSPNLLPEGIRLKEIKTTQYRLFKTDMGWAMEPANPNLSSDDLNRRVQDWLRAQSLQIVALDRIEAGEEVVLRREDDRADHFLIQQRDGQVWLIRSDLKIGYLLPGGSGLLTPPGSGKPQSPADSSPLPETPVN